MQSFFCFFFKQIYLVLYIIVLSTLVDFQYRAVILNSIYISMCKVTNELVVNIVPVRLVHTNWRWACKYIHTVRS